MERRAIAQRLAPAMLTPARAGLDGEAAIARMADDMIEISAASGNADRDALALRGWLYPQIDEYGGRARDAAQRAQLMVAA